MVMKWRAMVKMRRHEARNGMRRAYRLLPGDLPAIRGFTAPRACPIGGAVSREKVRLQ